MSKITIGFDFTDEYENFYSSSTTQEVFPEPGDTVLAVIGEKLNAFLRQAGYCRKNDYILMEDLTEDELDSLQLYLCELRDKQNEVEI